jgi:hypothetical protein
VIELAAHEAAVMSRETLIAIARHATNPGQEHLPIARVAKEYFRRAQARGEVRSELTPAELVAVFFPGVLGALLLESETGPRAARARLYHVVDVFVRGLVA